MKDYHDFYLKSGVLFLADVFEKFRNNKVQEVELFIFLIDIAKLAISI